MIKDKGLQDEGKSNLRKYSSSSKALLKSKAKFDKFNIWL